MVNYLWLPPNHPQNLTVHNILILRLFKTSVESGTLALVTYYCPLQHDNYSNLRVFFLSFLWLWSPNLALNSINDVQQFLLVLFTTAHVCMSFSYKSFNFVMIQLPILRTISTSCNFFLMLFYNKHLVCLSKFTLFYFIL